MQGCACTLLITTTPQEEKAMLHSYRSGKRAGAVQLCCVYRNESWRRVLASIRRTRRSGVGNLTNGSSRSLVRMWYR